MSDPDRIFLQPDCCADPSTGRLWCQDNVWPDSGDCDKTGIEYIRADLEKRTDSSTDALIEQLREGEWWQAVVRGSNPTGFSTDQTEAVRKAADRLAALPPSREVERVTLLYKFGGASEATKGWNAAIDAALNALRNSDGETK